MVGVLYFRVPFFGVRHLTIDKQGLGCASFIVAYWICGTFITLFCTLLPQFYAGNVPCWILAGRISRSANKKELVFVYLWVSAATIISLINAGTSDPGIIAQPQNDIDVLSQNYFIQATYQKPEQKSKNDDPMTRVNMEGINDFEDGDDGSASTERTFCEKCEIWRPPRAHHCRRCGVCIRRMDHHCPWINNCVGALNLYLFLNLLTYAFLLSFLTFTFNILQLKVYDEPVFDEASHDPFIVYRDGLRIFVCVLGVLMMIFMLGLMYQMHSNLLDNKTMLEAMRTNMKSHGAKDGGHKHGHGHGHEHGHGHGHSHSHPNSNESASIPSKSSEEACNHNHNAEKPKIETARQSCCVAYRRLCGRRPIVAWLIPLELSCPPPVPKVVENAKFTFTE